MSKVQVDTIDTRSGTSTMQIGSTNTSTINIGVSGDTVNIPSGVTIANAGTATGFGESNTPTFKVNRSSNQSIAHNTRTKIQWNNEVFDADNVFDSSTNHRFTVPSGKAGVYFFYLQIMVASFSGSTSSHKFVNAEIDVNGSIVAKSSEPFHIANASDFYSRLSTSLNLSVGDYVETYIYQDNDEGSAKNVYGDGNNYYSYFTGFRVSS